MRSKGPERGSAGQVNPITRKKGESHMSIFYVIGVIVVVVFVVRYLGLM
ncbi:MAG: hypothetical protein OEN50_04910 [Deltaproteobacteria bacterium]|nr:hypothetical protein [Deltaproteobacteria bacterium]